MDAEKFYARTMELEKAITVKRIDCEILNKVNKYNCYMRVIQDLDLLYEYSDYKRRNKCQEES